MRAVTSSAHTWGREVAPFRAFDMIASKPCKLFMCMVPAPDICLSPNARVHWARRASITKRVRADAHAIATAAMLTSKGYQFPWRGATLFTTWFMRDKRSLSDDDNLIGRFKAVRDGIADAGLVTDDKHFVMAPPVQEIDRKCPRLEIVAVER